MAKFAPQYNLFKIIDRLRSLLSWIFWLVFLLSILPALIKLFGIDINADDIISTSNIVAIGLTFVLELLVEFILVPQADSKRRDDFIDNSFGSSFSSTPSVGYYDNDEVKKGLYRASVNLFENCFFTYSLVKSVTLRKIIMPAVIMLTVAISAFYGFKQVPFALSLLQVLFSMNLLGELVKHCILLVKLHGIQDCWITLFQHEEYKTEVNKYVTSIYRYWLQYEALHSRIQAGIPDSHFKKLNDPLTKEWSEIKKRYNIN